jgi:hypothetical protein
LYEKKLRVFLSAPDTIVIDELGLSHAKVRIDVAIINGCVHGYEIKSGLDTLERLPAQLGLYTQCLAKLTLICAQRHVDKASKAAPDWCGIWEAKKGPRGAMSFSTVRKAETNPNIDAVQLAHLLWRPEALALLAAFGVSANVSKMPRRELYEIIAARMSVKELTAAIRNAMQLRRAWRDRPVLA